jgi:hypothetical protein
MPGATRKACSFPSARDDPFKTEGKAPLWANEEKKGLTQPVSFPQDSRRDKSNEGRDR